MPLIAAWQNLVTPAGLVIGPPVILLTSVALIAGFLLLLSEAAGGVLSFALAPVVSLCLGGCDTLVDWANGWSWGWFYVPDLPAWWLWVFYAGLLTGLFAGASGAWLWRLAVAGAGWVCVGLLAGAVRPAADELRVTFLAVGHGGCAVLETPDGRTLLYDAGAIRGPHPAGHAVHQPGQDRFDLRICAWLGPQRPLRTDRPASLADLDRTGIPVVREGV